MRRYIRFLLIAVDQLCNAITGGYPDETLSSRIWRHAVQPWPRRRWTIARKVVDKVFFWQDGHCRLAYEMERKRRHLPKELAR